MRLSIVATLYNSTSYIEEFCRRSRDVATKLVGDDFEIILVNDGSPDDSLAVSLHLQAQFPQLKIIDLTRNFGHHQAMIAGLSSTQGERVWLIDIDLEESPEWLEEFSDQMQGDDIDVVYGVQKSRKGNWFERISGEIYYFLLNSLLDFHHPRNITTARLMSKRFVAALLQHREREIVISALWYITGFKQLAVTVEKKSSSKTTYSLARKFAHVVNAITSFSSKPLNMIFFAGLSIFTGSLFYAGYLVVRRLFYSIPVDGYTSLMVSVWLLGGLTILFIGIIGIYLAKIFSETKQRPLFLVKAVYEPKS